MDKNTIVIIDYGSQYTQLIARRVRELNVFSIIVPYDFDESYLDVNNIKGIILSGGPSSVYEKQSPKLNKIILSYNTPILGICYGLQLLIEEFNGLVKNLGTGEYGPSMIQIENNNKLFKDISTSTKVWMSHGDRIDSMPSNWEVTSKSENGIISSVQDNNSLIYGVQFHPEVVHTKEGKQIIHNFIFDICKAIPNWSSENFISDTITDIQNTVQDSKVLCALSGGVDSTVVSTILKKAIGEEILRQPDAKDQIIKFYSENSQALASLKAPIFEQKVVNYILENIKFEEKEISREELLKK